MDRDGTILEEVEGESSETLGYLLSVEDVKLISGSASAIAEARELGFKIIVVTNQSSIARGWLTFETLNNINNKMFSLLLEENSEAKIDALYFSPYHIEGKIKEFSIDHISRKPGIGMIKQAEHEYNIDIASSYIIGDAYSDMKTGINAGLHNILVSTGYGKIAQRKCLDENVKIDFIASNLLDAVRFIAKNS